MKALQVNQNVRFNDGQYGYIESVSADRDGNDGAYGVLRTPSGAVFTVRASECSLAAPAAKKAAKTDPFSSPEYWRGLARCERAFAQAERTGRAGTVESIRIHEQNAVDYEARAKQLEAREVRS